MIKMNQLVLVNDLGLKKTLEI